MSTYNKEVLDISNDILSLVKENLPNLYKSFIDITYLFTHNPYKIKVFFTYNFTSHNRNVCTAPAHLIIDIYMDGNEFYKNEEINESLFLESIFHETIHVMDFLKSNNKKLSHKSLSNLDLKNDISYSHVYYCDIYEFNVLINKIKLAYKISNKFKEDWSNVKNYKDILSVIDKLECSRFFPKYFIKDEVWRNRLYKRLYKEKLI